MKFQIEGFEDTVSVTDLYINRKVNEHTQCNITLLLKESDISSAIGKYGSKADSPVTVKFGDNSEYSPIFVGYIEQINIQTSGVVTVQLSCYSNSKKEDKVKNTFIYQDTEKKIGDILKLLDAASMPPFFLDKNLEQKKIPEVVIQNEETDFSFLRRIINNEDGVVIPESLVAGGKLWIGEREGNTFNKEITNYSISNTKECSRASFTMDNTFLELGDRVNLGSKTYFVIENTITYEQGVCVCSYTLQENYKNLVVESEQGSKNKFIGKIFKNEDKEMAGRVQVVFEEDKCKNKDKFLWFKRITPYASKDTGFYFIPAVDEKVIVNFENLSEPYIEGSIRNNKHENFKDPKEQFIKNDFNKEINLKEKEINIISVFNQTFLSLSEDKIELSNDKAGILIEKEKITLQNNKTIIVIDDDIHIAKADGSKMILGDKILLESKNKSKVDLDSNVEVKGENLTMESSGSKIELDSDTKVKTSTFKVTASSSEFS